MLRQTLTVARRDFTATVMTPTFLLFLLSPLLMIGFGVVGSMSATSAAGSGEERERIVLSPRPARQPRSPRSTSNCARSSPTPKARPALHIEGPGDDIPAQARALLDSNQFDAAAVLYGPLDRPHILRRPSGYSEGIYLAQLAEQALRAERSGGAKPLSEAEITVVSSGQATAAAAVRPPISPRSASSSSP
jgi:ABC-2 type transport system permease protein